MDLTESGPLNLDSAEYEDFMNKRKSQTGFGKTPESSPKIHMWPKKEDVVPYPPVNIITRKMWRAELPSKIIPESLPHDVIMLENDSGTDFCFNRKACTRMVRDIQKTHMTELGETDIQYNFLLGEDGNVYEGRGWWAQSARTLKALTDFPHRLDVAYLGKHDSNKPNLELFCLLKTLLRYGVKEGFISRNFSLVEVKDDLRFNKYVVDIDVYIQMWFYCSNALSLINKTVKVTV